MAQASLTPKLRALCSGLALAALAWAPARAQTGPLPELFSYECRIVHDGACTCAAGRNKPEIAYSQLADRLAKLPPRSVEGHDALMRQASWRRQCGLVTDEDIEP